MNPHDHNPGSATDHDDMPDALRWQLRGLRRDALPQHDLWAGIAERITAETGTTQVASSNVVALRSRSRRLGWLAMAASVALAVGIGWQLRPAALDVERDTKPLAQTADLPGNPASIVISREAAAMTWEYKAALREISAHDMPVADSRALQELDRSAMQVRSALAEHPEARFLLDKLQRLYAQRLALTQRLVLS